jgi:hypothetical protein
MILCTHTHRPMYTRMSMFLCIAIDTLGMTGWIGQNVGSGRWELDSYRCRPRWKVILGGGRSLWDGSPTKGLTFHVYMKA